MGQPQLRRLKEELYHADRVMNAIGRGTSQWSDLLRENGFFNDHIHFLQVSFISCLFLQSVVNIIYLCILIKQFHFYHELLGQHRSEQ